MNAFRIGFAEALGLVTEAVSPGPNEAVPTHAAAGRILAQDVIAARDFPPFDMSAMDGFAIGEDRIAGPVERRLRLGTPQYAGDPARLLAPDEAMPIFTGAAVPQNAAAVLIKEKATILDDALVLTEEVPLHANIRRTGEDARAGERVLSAGYRIDAAAIGALSCYGVGALSVRAKPKVAMLVLGDELVPADGAAAGGIIDANGPMVAAALVEAGCEILQRVTVRDEIDAICDALLEALSAGPDIIVTTGGASVGARDYVRHAVERIGATVHFHGVHMRPGKPVLFARSGGGTPIFGLPGNPVSALVGTRFFVMAAVRALLGLAPERAALVLPEPPEAGPTRFLKARRTGLEKPGGAGMEITILPGQQSHLMRPLLEANAWLVRGGNSPSTLFPLFDDLRG